MAQKNFSDRIIETMTPRNWAELEAMNKFVKADAIRMMHTLMLLQHQHATTTANLLETFGRQYYDACPEYYGACLAARVESGSLFADSKDPRETLETFRRRVRLAACFVAAADVMTVNVYRAHGQVSAKETPSVLDQDIGNVQTKEARAVMDVVREQLGFLDRGIAEKLAQKLKLSLKDYPLPDTRLDIGPRNFDEHAAFARLRDFRVCETLATSALENDANKDTIDAYITRREALYGARLGKLDTKIGKILYNKKDTDFADTARGLGGSVAMAAHAALQLTAEEQALVTRDIPEPQSASREVLEARLEAQYAHVEATLRAHAQKAKQQGIMPNNVSTMIRIVREENGLLPTRVENTLRRALGLAELNA